MAGQAAQQERGDTWDGLIRREVAVTVRVVSQEERSIEVIASTEALDSHGDIVKQYWDLSRFEKNGPILWNHNLSTYWGSGSPEDSMPIGRGEARVEGGKLIAKCWLVKGTKEEEPFVDKLWRRIEQNVIKAVSVGFKPGSVTCIVKPDGGTDHYELGSAQNPNELREISFVPMGSNPDAVAKSLAFERKHFAAMASAGQTNNQETEAPMAMTPDEMKMLNDAQGEAKSLRDRVTTLEKDLAGEKTDKARFETDLTKATERATKAESSLIETSLKALVGVKLAPTELEEEVALAKEIGLDRVMKRLEKRPDMKLLAPVEVNGKTVADKTEPREPLVEETGDGSSDIVKAANAASSAA
jgi:hypothetical protein